MALEEGRTASVVSMRGVLDAETTPRLESVLKKASGRPKPITLLRFSEVDYVNSSGMGLLIKYADIHQAAGGAFGLLEVSPKTLALFRMLGLLSVLKTYPNQAQALAEIQGAPVRPAPSPPTARVRAPAPPPPEPIPASPFPLEMACQGCGARLAFPEPGFYKCAGCGAAYQAGASGETQALQRSGASPFEASFPYDAAFLDGISAVAGRSAERAGLVGQDVEELLTVFRRMAEYLIVQGKGKGRSLKVLIAAAPGECLVGFRTDLRFLNGKPDPAIDPFEASDTPGGHLFKYRRKAGEPVRTEASSG